MILLRISGHRRQPSELQFNMNSRGSRSAAGDQSGISPKKRMGRRGLVPQFSFSLPPPTPVHLLRVSLVDIYETQKKLPRKRVRNSITGVDVRSCIVQYCLFLCFEVCVWSRHKSLSSFPRRRSLGFVRRTCGRIARTSLKNVSVGGYISGELF